MRNFKITLEYDGTNFKGWQIQPDGRSVQGEVEKALHRIFKKGTRIIGSGRTDQGVHSLGQVGNFKADTAFKADKVLRALNANLPEDISVLHVMEVPPDFHAQYSAKSKIYRYTILNRPARCAQLRQFCLHIPYRLNVSAMRKESKSLIGKKDFRSFVANDPSRDQIDTVRTIKRINITKRGDTITIDLEADGFLYKMVRGIIGTLIEIGRGQLQQGSIKKVLKQKDRTAAAYSAKPHGLCLLSVKY